MAPQGGKARAKHATKRSAHRAHAVVAGAAVASRACCVALSFASAMLIQPYDRSNRPAAFPPLQALCNWDGVYFTAIAERGYAYEQEFAFFPLLPTLAGALSRVLRVSPCLAAVLVRWVAGAHTQRVSPSGS